MAFCTNCGTQLNEGNRFCPACGTKTNLADVPVEPVKQEPVQVQAEPEVAPVVVAQPESTVVAQPKSTVVVSEPKRFVRKVCAPPNYRGRAITSIFFFWPIAIAAMVNSGRVDELNGQGRHQEALRYSEKVYRQSTTAIVLGSISIVFWWFIYILVVILDAASSF